MRKWVDQAMTRVEHLEERIDELKLLYGAHPWWEKACDERFGLLAYLEKEIEKAQSVLQERSASRWAFSGTSANLVWNRINHVEEQLCEHFETEANTVVCARLHAKESGIEVDKHAALNREQALAIIREAHHIAESKHESQRNHRRGSYVVSVILLLLAVVLVVLQALVPEPFVPSPTDMTVDVAPWVLLLVIMLFGAAGGTLSGLMTLYVADKGIPDTLWFDLRPSLLFIKIITGMWTALIGLALVGTETVVGLYTSLPSLLLLAMVFGYAQQVVTTFVDRRAGQVL